MSKSELSETYADPNLQADFKLKQSSIQALQNF